MHKNSDISGVEFQKSQYNYNENCMDWQSSAWTVHRMHPGPQSDTSSRLCVSGGGEAGVALHEPRTNYSIKYIVK